MHNIYKADDEEAQLKEWRAKNETQMRQRQTWDQVQDYY